MSWPYRFILTLPDADLERRRKILDSKGVYAQISALSFLGLLILFRSKGGKQSQFLQSGRANSAKSWWNTPVVRGGSETRKQYVVVLLWLFWLVCLSVWKTGDGEFFFTYTHTYFYASERQKLLRHPANNMDIRLPSLNQSTGPRRSLSITFPGTSSAYLILFHFQLYAYAAIHRFLRERNSAASLDCLSPSSGPTYHNPTTLQPRRAFSALLCSSTSPRVWHCLCQTHSGLRCSVRTGSDFHRASGPDPWPC